MPCNRFEKLQHGSLCVGPESCSHGSWCTLGAAASCCLPRDVHSLRRSLSLLEISATGIGVWVRAVLLKYGLLFWLEACHVVKS